MPSKRILLTSDLVQISTHEVDLLHTFLSPFFDICSSNTSVLIQYRDFAPAVLQDLQIDSDA